ncbi:MAG: aldolase/citrate lyase family protein [Caulobacteraceae bacterium]
MDQTTAASALRDKLRGEGLWMAWFSIGSVPVMELGVRAGFDAAVVDLQHGLWDRLSAHLAVSASGATPVLARTASATPEAIGEALDSGAVGVIVPLIETAAQAASVVAATNFPPRGNRSGGGVRPVGEGFANYWRRSAAPIVGVMIETVAGLHNAAEIARTPGLDLVFIGPGDLALSIGCFPELDARHEEACQAILQACRAAETPCGIFTFNATAARARLEEGYAAAVAANDIEVVASGFAAGRRGIE